MTYRISKTEKELKGITIKGYSITAKDVIEKFLIDKDCSEQYIKNCVDKTISSLDDYYYYAGTKRHYDILFRLIMKERENYSFNEYLKYFEELAEEFCLYTRYEPLGRKARLVQKYLKEKKNESSNDKHTT